MSSGTKKWSQKVTDSSHALNLEENVFLKENPQDIALSLKRSAEKSTQRKSSPFQSAMSMLNFYINRAGKNLSTSRRKILNQSKEELRILFDKETSQKTD